MAEQFGKYTLENKLATGGMAEIFQAIQRGPDGFERQVAIKRILQQVSEDPSFVAMFLDEARLVSRFNHPNIVQVFDFGRVRGRYYLAMELLRGANLADVVRRCREEDEFIPLELTAKIISQACQGLEYAHSFSDLALIHRDVSPQNLLLTYDGVVKLLDFGIAKAASNYNVTRAKVVKGKIPYMSPEQVHRAGGELDRRSDLFSIGVVLFQMVTGRLPFTAQSELEMMRAILRNEAPDPRSMNDSIPLALAAIVQRALAKDREERYQTAREMMTDLERYLVEQRQVVDSFTLGNFVRERCAPSGVAHDSGSSSDPHRPTAADRQATQPAEQPETMLFEDHGAQASGVSEDSLAQQQLISTGELPEKQPDQGPVTQPDSAPQEPAAESGPGYGVTRPDALVKQDSTAAKGGMPWRRIALSGLLLAGLIVAGTLIYSIIQEAIQDPFPSGGNSSRGDQLSPAFPLHTVDGGKAAQAQAAFARADYREAIGLYEEALKEKSPDPELHRLLAESLESLGESSKAIFHYRRYLDLCARCPHAPRVRVSLGQIDSSGMIGAGTTAPEGEQDSKIKKQVEQAEKRRRSQARARRLTRQLLKVEKRILQQR